MSDLMNLHILRDTILLLKGAVYKTILGPK